MALQIHDRYDEERGCGWRKEGGLYMVSGGMSRGCGKLPIALTVCPCCHAGIKPTRGYTWVTYDLIKDAPCNATRYEEFADLTLPVKCGGCHPFDGSIERFGLLWVGGQFYKDPKTFTAESARLGISRRISALPNDFKVGETWVLLAHRECIVNPNYPHIGMEIHQTIEGFEGSTGNRWRFHEINKDTSVLVRARDVEFKTVTNSSLDAFKEPTHIAGIFQAFQPVAIEYVVKGTETDEELEALIKRGITCVKVHKKEGASVGTDGDHDITQENGFDDAEV